MKLKKNVKIVLIICIIAILLILGGLLIPKFIHPEEKTSPVTIESNIDAYGYELKSNQTNLYRDLFRQLESVLNAEDVNSEEYVTLLTKLFIADFYNLDSKLTNMDIGGVQFVHTSIRDNFVLNAENTMYQYIKNNVYGDRVQELPEVSDITNVELEQISYTYNNVTDKKAYQVKASWTYLKDLGYETEKTFIFVHEDNKLALVEMK